MRSYMRFLAILNLGVAVMIGSFVAAQEEDPPVTVTLGPKPIKNADCRSQSCGGSVSTNGSGSTLASGCTWTAATSTCGGTCHRCNGSNPSGRTENCVNITGTGDCQPDGNDAQFTCGTGDAQACTAAGGNSSLSCCSNTLLPPPATGGSCANSTCLSI